MQEERRNYLSVTKPTESNYVTELHKTSDKKKDGKKRIIFVSRVSQMHVSMVFVLWGHHNEQCVLMNATSVLQHTWPNTKPSRSSHPQPHPPSPNPTREMELCHVMPSEKCRAAKQQKRTAHTWKHFSPRKLPNSPGEASEIWSKQLWNNILPKTSAGTSALQTGLVGGLRNMSDDGVLTQSWNCT